MIRNVWAIIGIACCLLVPQAEAVFQANGDFLTGLNGAVSSGTITVDEAYIEVFRYAFEPELVRPEFMTGDNKPLKCLSQVISDYEESRDQFSAGTREIVDRYLESSRSANKTAATYMSPSGIFELTYSTSGSNAVPAADNNPANGIPDYVEKVAVYADSSWTREITEMGFIAPELTSGVYPLSFQNMGAYGYAVSTGFGKSYIVLENDFVGFPGNQDPEGNQLGSAKATMAHEFKHASQFNTGSWDGWAESDATFAEDMVFDETNDYYNYLFSSNNIVQPWTPLDDGGGASYEDCIWQLFVEEHFGPGSNQVVAQRRADFNESIENSFGAFFDDNGSSWRDAFDDFMVYNYLVGLNSTSSLPGYEESADFPMLFPGLTETVTLAMYPYAYSGTQANQSADFFKLKGLPGFSGTIRVEFDGLVTSRPQDVIILFKVKDEFGGGWEREDMTLDANVDGDHTVSRPASELLQGAVLVTYPKKTGSDSNYDIIISDGPTSTSVGNTPSPVAFRLEQNRPNPFNPATTIRFNLDQSAATSLRIYDPAGRLVRTLVAKELGAGSHVRSWDGRDDSGRNASSGVYYYKLDTGEATDSKRMILIR